MHLYLSHMCSAHMVELTVYGLLEVNSAHTESLIDPTYCLLNEWPLL